MTGAFDRLSWRSVFFDLLSVFSRPRGCYWQFNVEWVLNACSRDMMIFKNRDEAGRRLAEKLKRYKGTNSVVLGLARGGVPVAAKVASALEVPLDVLLVRKIGAPFNPELAVGAIAENSSVVWNQEILQSLGLKPEDLKGQVGQKSAELETMGRKLRGGRELVELEGRTLLVVDDGVATGATLLAAIESLKKTNPAQLIVAVPVAAESSVSKMLRHVDEFVAVKRTDMLSSVGEWYEDFSAVTDDEVIAALNEQDQKMRAKDGLRKTEAIGVQVGKAFLNGDLTTFAGMKAMIVFVHGSGSSRLSTRNRLVARHLNEMGFGTLLFDLLTLSEAENRDLVFDIDLLTDRLLAVTDWARRHLKPLDLPVGYFGASTGAAAALRAAVELKKNEKVFAIVSRGGRPDLARSILDAVEVPTLFIVGGDDTAVLKINEVAAKRVKNSQVYIVPGASHLFEEPGALEKVAHEAGEWLSGKLQVKLKAG